MKIEDLMSKNVITVHLDDRLTKVKELFEENSFHHLMVVNEEGELVGVLSTRDYAKAIHPNVGMPSATSKDLASLNKRVHQIVRRRVISVAADAALSSAIKLFYEKKISCLPILDDKKHVIGVLSWRDVFRWLYEKMNTK